jgi:hypothetical protein
MSSTVRDVTTSGGEEQTQEQKVTTVLDLVNGDGSLEREILDYFKANPDAPPLLFEWDDTNLGEFWTRAVAYGGVPNAHAPPQQINGGAHLVRAATPANTLLLKRWILSLLAANFSAVIIGGPDSAVGLYLPFVQACGVCSRMGVMNNRPWFQGVLQNGPPLPGVLGCLRLPRAPNNRICDLVPVTSGEGPLWP